MDLSRIEVDDGGIAFHLREGLEDGRYQIHTLPRGSKHQDGYEKRTWPRYFFPSMFLLLYSIQQIFFHIIMDTLIEQFELRQTGRFRGVVNADDVLAIFHHFWVLSDLYYPEERQRLQHAVMDIFCGSTTARGGTVVESSGYFGRNDALKYKDIELYACRDSEYPGRRQVGHAYPAATV